MMMLSTVLLYMILAAQILHVIYFKKSSISFKELGLCL
jgi:hypothetical protein